MKASGDSESERFKESAVRHFFQWLNGDVDEDHAAAVFFNINGFEYVKARENKSRSVAAILGTCGVPVTHDLTPE
jgi:hypothetical protein